MSGIQSTIDILNNLDATSAPGVTDDTTVGYSINSVWIDVTNKLVYTCVDATSGAAVWITGNATKDNLTASVDPTATDDSSAGYAVGSTWINTTADTDWRCVDATNGAAVWFKAEPANANIQTHISSTSNPHSVTTTQIGAATIAEVALKADINSPTLTGIPNAPTAAIGTITTQIATTAFVSANGVPVGAVVPFFGGTVHSGFLKANGAAYSRTTYADLFAEIGTTYGAGDGSTTFNVPDSRGETLRGWDDGRGVDSGRALGSWQADQSANIRSISSTTTGNSGDNIIPTDGSFSVGSFSGVNGAGAGVYISARIWNIETRSRNLAVQFLIKY